MPYRKAENHDAKIAMQEVNAKHGHDHRARRYFASVVHLWQQQIRSSVASSVPLEVAICSQCPTLSEAPAVAHLKMHQMNSEHKGSTQCLQFRFRIFEVLLVD